MKNTYCPLVKWVEELLASHNRIEGALVRCIELIGPQKVRWFIDEEGFTTLEDFINVVERTLLTTNERNFKMLVNLGFKAELNIEETTPVEDPEWSYADEVIDNVYEDAYITVDDRDEDRREVARAEEKEPPIGGSYPPADLRAKWDKILLKEGYKNF